MDNRLDSPLISSGKGPPLSDSVLSGCSGGLVTPSSDGSSPPGLRPDGTEKGSREADGTGGDKEAGALLLLSATSDDLMSLSGDMDSLIFREALALADQFANAKEDEESGAMATSWQRLSADNGHMAQMLASGAESAAVTPPPEPRRERRRTPSPVRRARTPIEQRPRPPETAEPPVLEVSCYRMSEPPPAPPAEPRRYRLAESPAAERERAARAASPAYAALCEKASAELRQLEMQTQEEYENLQFEALERSVSAATAPRRPPQLTPWDAARSDSGTCRVTKGHHGVYRAPRAAAAAAAQQPELSTVPSMVPPESERPPRLLAGRTQTPARQQQHQHHRLSGPRLNDTFGRGARMDRTFDTGAPLDRTFDTEMPFDRTLDATAPLDGTFKARAPLDYSFDPEGPLNSTFNSQALELDGTFVTDSRLDLPDLSADLSLDLMDDSPAPRRRSSAPGRRLGRPAGGGAPALDQTFDVGGAAGRRGEGLEQDRASAGRRTTLDSTFDGVPPGDAPSLAAGAHRWAGGDAPDKGSGVLNRAIGRETRMGRAANQEPSLNRTMDRPAAANRTADQESSLNHTMDRPATLNRTLGSEVSVNRTMNREELLNRTMDRDVLPGQAGDTGHLLGRTASRGAPLDRTSDQDEPLSGAAGVAERVPRRLDGGGGGSAGTGALADESRRPARYGSPPVAGSDSLQQAVNGALTDLKNEPPARPCDSSGSSRVSPAGSQELPARSPEPEPVSVSGRAVRRPAGPVTSTPRRSVSSVNSAGLTPISAAGSPAAEPPAAVLRAPAVPPAGGRNGLVRLAAHQAVLVPRANGLVRPITGLARPSGALRPSGLPAPRAAAPAAASGLRSPSARGLRAPSASGLRPPAASGLRRPTPTAAAAAQRVQPAPQAAPAEVASRAAGRPPTSRDSVVPAAARPYGLAPPRASGLPAPAAGRTSSALPTARGSRLPAPAPAHRPAAPAGGAGRSLRVPGFFRRP